MSTNYSRQKAQTFTHFRVNKADLKRLVEGQFTIYDFISNCFSFSEANKRVAVRVLELLKEKPHSFIDLCKETGANKSSLYLLLLSLERAGLILRNGINYGLSKDFSELICAYAAWWHTWLRN